MTLELDDKQLLVHLHNDPEFIGFLLKLSKDDMAAFLQIAHWSRSLLGMLINTKINLVELLNRSTDQDKAAIKQMASWPDSLIGLLAKTPRVLKFLNRISDTELQSILQIATWPPSLLALLRTEPSHIMVIHKMWDLVPDMTAFLKSYFSIYTDAAFDLAHMPDAFSSGQLDSKVWLLDTLADLQLPLGRTWVLCGWIGTLSYLALLRSTALSISAIRSFDIDDRCAALADTMNRPAVVNNWQFKATTLDVNMLQYDNFSYTTFKRDGAPQMVIETADTIINTSCDHMGNLNQWWDAIPAGKLVILQNNDFFEVADHSNCCFSLHEFKQQYPMQQILFEGTLDCTIYNRFMLIGYK